jgi:hypothetical protein
MDKHKGHKIGVILGQAGVAQYCLDCSQVLESLETVVERLKKLKEESNV